MIEWRLIPPQEQWKKQKQTKEQAAAARRAKLDPSAAKSAKDVMDERARKRKLEDAGSDVEGVAMELPKQGLKVPVEKKAKKQKTTGEGGAVKSDGTASHVEKRKLKRDAKKEKKVQRARKADEQAQHQAETQPNDKEVQDVEMTDEIVPLQVTGDAGEDGSSKSDDSDEVSPFDASGLLDDGTEKDVPTSLTSPSSPSPTPTFDTLASKPGCTSTSTSTSSCTASTNSKIKVPSIATETLKARLAARIEALRAARKADGVEGTPARTRQELMESRRKKEEQRRAMKKELRAKARQAEEEERDRALERASASARGSPSIASVTDAADENFSFGRLRWDDGSEALSTGDGFRSARKERGPRGGDVAGALKQLERKTERISGMDEEKRLAVEEREQWSTARKLAGGERILDDGGLLKKALKRREQAKRKSEKQWDARKEGVERSQQARQKKREENLRKRRDDKGSKGKKKKKKSSSTGSQGKKASRPGFEGNFGKRK